jgi:hypothetical protein
LVYLEYVLRGIDVGSAPTVIIVRGAEAGWIFDDLRAELLDLWPRASVRALALADLPGCDLAVVPLADRPAAPLQDVVYGALDTLARAQPALARARYLLFHRVWWREADVVASADLARYLRRKRREHALIRLASRPAVGRRLKAATV